MEEASKTKEQKIKNFETELEKIDSEIVGVGENMSQQRLDELTKRRHQIARWIAELKGENITSPATDWNPEKRFIK